MTKMYGIKHGFESGSGKFFARNKDQRYWNEDFYINSIAYTSKGWFVTMAKGLKWDKSIIQLQIIMALTNGYMKRKLRLYDNIIIPGNSNWMVVMSQKYWL